MPIIYKISFGAKSVSRILLMKRNVSKTAFTLRGVKVTLLTHTYTSHIGRLKWPSTITRQSGDFTFGLLVDLVMRKYRVYLWSKCGKNRSITHSNFNLTGV